MSHATPQNVARSRRHGPLGQAQGGPALPPRQGQLRRRHPAARACSTWTSCAAPTRTRRSSRSTPTQALKVPGVLAVITGETLEQYNLHWMPTLMSDTQMVLPDREGDVPGPGGRGRHRDGPLRGGRRRRGRARSSTSRCRSSWIRSRPSSPARRSCAPTSRARRTTTSSTGRSATAAATDKALPRLGRRRQAGDLHPAHPRRLDRDLRLRGRLRPRARQAHGLHDDPGAARDPHGDRAGGRARRASRRRRSASSRRTSAAASAARCRSIRATSSPSRPRSSSASPSSGSRTGWRTSRRTPSPATTT